jgi:hypothetical protein
MTDLIVGIKHVRDEIEILPIAGIEMSVAGFIGTAPDADEDAFPLNTAIYLTTNMAAEIVLLGDTGTLPDAIRGVTDQLGVDQRAARIVIVRVEEGPDVAQTIGNIIGEEDDKTGIWAFLDSATVLGVTPRLCAAPGFTSQRYAPLENPVISNGGTGYSGTINVVFTGGTPVRPAAATAVLATGVVTGFTWTDRGLYTTPPAISLSGGGGTGFAATVTLDDLANPVCAAIPTILDRMRAMFIADGPASSRQAWIDWRETIQSDRIIPLAIDVKIAIGDGSIVVKPASPRVIGIGIRRDHEFDGRPFHSWANQPVRGIVGPSRPIAFSLTDGAVEAQDLISRNAGVIVRGESGVEDAIAEGGFVFWGTDTCSEDPLWMFYHVMRGRDYIELGQIKTLRFYLGRFNITTQTVQAILNTMDSGLSILRARGDILDYRVGFEADKNSPEELRVGHVQVMFRAEEPPVLRKIIISSRRYREALVNLTRTIATQLSSVGTTNF